MSTGSRESILFINYLVKLRTFLVFQMFERAFFTARCEGKKADEEEVKKFFEAHFDDFVF